MTLHSAASGRIAEREPEAATQSRVEGGFEIVCIDLNGEMHEMVRLDGDQMFEGVLSGEDADGTAWRMPFWLPADVVEDWRC